MAAGQLKLIEHQFAKFVKTLDFAQESATAKEENKTIKCNDTTVITHFSQKNGNYTQGGICIMNCSYRPITNFNILWSQVP